MASSSSGWSADTPRHNHTPSVINSNEQPSPRSVKTAKRRARNRRHYDRAKLRKMGVDPNETPVSTPAAVPSPSKARQHIFAPRRLEMNRLAAGGTLGEIGREADRQEAAPQEEDAGVAAGEAEQDGEVQENSPPLLEDDLCQEDAGDVGGGDHSDGDDGGLEAAFSDDDDQDEVQAEAERLPEPAQFPVSPTKARPPRDQQEEQLDKDRQDADSIAAFFSSLKYCGQISWGMTDRILTFVKANGRRIQELAERNRIPTVQTMRRRNRNSVPQVRKITRSELSSNVYFFPPPRS